MVALVALDNFFFLKYNKILLYNNTNTFFYIYLFLPKKLISTFIYICTGELQIVQLTNGVQQKILTL